ncbi:MAG: hypothetical protein Kow0040_24460 [Thermogutta sp.]
MPINLLDYGIPNPFGETIGRPRYLAWPVNVYRVTLPKAMEDSEGGNPFERVVLKLLSAVGRMDARELADETCIPFDLVKYVLLRLRDKGFIDDHNAVSKQKEGGFHNHEARESVFVTAILFRELATGRILPFLHVVNDGNPLRKRNDDRFVTIVSSNDVHSRTIPVPRDVINALRAMKRRAASLGRNDAMPAVRQITILPQPDRYYLFCPIAIQKSDGEFRIADPFGYGFSLVLESAFLELLEQNAQLNAWLQEWKEALSNPRSQQLPLKEEPKEPFENEANCRRYPELIANLRLSRRASFRSISQIHASIEWALFYVSSARPFEEAIAQLTFTKQQEHPRLLDDAARRVGLKSPKYGFRPIPEGKLRVFREGQAELGTVVAIALLQAVKDGSHPLRRVALTYTDFIDRLFEIKRRRDEKEHGTGRADVPETELPDDRLMRECIQLLLPDIRFADRPVPGPNKDTRGDLLLDARAGIQSEFGFKLFNRLGPNLQERLVHAETFWLTCRDGDDALVLVCDLYAAVQSSLENKILGALPPAIEDFELIERAEEKAVQAGLCKALPACLRTVKRLAIRRTLQGNAQTLGSCAIAFLLVSDSDTLDVIAAFQPSFLDDIANIISKRGHANEPLPLTKADIKALRKSAYRTIKTLFEVT